MFPTAIGMWNMLSDVNDPRPALHGERHPRLRPAEALELGDADQVGRFASAPGRQAVLRSLEPGADPLAADPVLRSTMGEKPGAAVLVVSDFSSISRSACRSLVRRGFTVIHAKSPEGGLALFQAHRRQVSLAVIDTLSPTAGCLDLAAELGRLRPGLRALHIVGARKTAARRSIEAHTLGWVLAMPFTEDRLIASIAGLIGMEADERLWSRLIAASERISSGTAVLCLYQTHQAGLAAGHAAALRAGGILHAFRPTNCQAAPLGMVVPAPDVERARSLTARVRAGQQHRSAA